MSVHHILTRPALVARAEKLLSEINTLFDDAAAHGITLEEFDADGKLGQVRAALIAGLERERIIHELRT